ncbi:hypothetical protein BDC45DRAFT_439982 [Circinella umbellata]|nr:hypothetical protein BDC45DRAFT_439982 [Circinella umbellata]
MSDLNWCTYCDNAIKGYSNSLYCSDECLRSDCLEHNPLLGYDYGELKNFPRPSSSFSTRKVTSAATSAATSAVISSSTTTHSDWDDSSFTTISSTISTPLSSPSTSPSTSTSSSTSSLLSPPPSPSNSYQEVYNLNYINNRNKTTMTTKHRTTPSIFYI